MAVMAKDKIQPERADGTDVEHNDGTDVEHTAGHGVTEGEPTLPEDDDELPQVPAEGNDPVVITDENVGDVSTDLPPGPVEGREEMGGQVPGGGSGHGVLRTPVEKGPQEGKIGVVERELTDLGEAVGIEHGVVSHDLNAEGIQPTGEPYMRCPVCGNVNIALHNKARTSAHCPACGWHTGSLSGDGNPPTKIPGVHEVDGGQADAGEIPKGKLEGALGMDPQEAKEGVFVQDMDRPVTTQHVGDDGERVGQSNADLPDGEIETAEGVMAGNDLTSTKNRRR